MWIQIDKDFHDKLSEYEPRIPWQSYGKGKFKPFLILFKVGDFNYVTQLTSSKNRHNKLSNARDIETFFNNQGIQVGAVNLNYMFPVPNSAIITYNEEDIRETLKEDKTEKQIENYINLLNLQEHLIKKSEVYNKAVALYQNIDSKEFAWIKERSFDFKDLERRVIEMELERVSNYEHSIQVTRTHNLFLADIDEDRYTLKYNDLNSLASLYQTHIAGLAFEDEESIELVNENVKEQGREM